MRAERGEQLVSKPVAAGKGIAKTTLSPSLAPRPRSIRRLQFVSLLRIGITLTMWLTTNLVQGHLRDELRSVAQWGPPVGAVAASLLMLAIAGSPAHARIHLIQEARPRGP